MNCCLDTASTGRFFSRVARWHRRRYLRKGLSKTQIQLVSGLNHAGIKGVSILEIGCGVGYLHQSLIEDGADHAVGVDLSPGMIREARRLARDKKLEVRTDYFEGDFVDLSPTLSEFDLVLLDKVICCYPDADRLVGLSVSKSRRLVGLTYPRDRWFLRLASYLGALIFRLFGSRFRGYVHDAARVTSRILDRGFQPIHESQTVFWTTQVFERLPRTMKGALSPNGGHQ